jgi:transglutaminase 1
MMKRKIMPKLVVRRGQPFRLRLYCNRPYDPEKDAITLILTVADVKQPNLGHGTLIGLLLSNNVNDQGPEDEWAAVLKGINGEVLDVLIKPAANALVTQWKIDFDTKLLNGTLARSFSLPQAIYVLFNPWCPQDQVYMPGRILLEISQNLT